MICGSCTNFEFSSGRANILEIAFFTMDQINDISGITRKPLFVLCCKIGFASLGAIKCVRVHKEIFTN